LLKISSLGVAQQEGKIIKARIVPPRRRQPTVL